MNQFGSKGGNIAFVYLSRSLLNESGLETMDKTSITLVIFSICLGVGIDTRHFNGSQFEWQ